MSTSPPYPNAVNDYRRCGRVRVARRAPASSSRLFEHPANVCAPPAGVRRATLASQPDSLSREDNGISPGTTGKKRLTALPLTPALSRRTVAQPCHTRRLLDASRPGERGKETIWGDPQFRTGRCTKSLLTIRGRTGLGAGLPTPPKPLTDRSPCPACFWTVACNACGVGRPAHSAEIFYEL